MNIKDAKKVLKEEPPGKDIKDLHKLTKSPKHIFNDCYLDKQAPTGMAEQRLKNLPCFLRKILSVYCTSFPLLLSPCMHSQCGSSKTTSMDFLHNAGITHLHGLRTVYRYDPF